MALTVTIGGVSQTAKVLEGSGSLKFNTYDVTLVDPATVPVNGNAVALTNPTWSGTVTSVTRYPGPRPGHKYVTVTATNTDVAGASAGPFGLSDTPNGSTTRGYKDLRVTVSANLDASTTTTGTCTLYTTGLWPAMTFTLTNADLGYAAQSFSVTGMTVTWTKGVPFYALTFGDPIVTMSVWMADTVTTMPDGSISGTKITDGSVTTPKLAANSVTADKITGGTITGDKLTTGAKVGLNEIVNGDFEDADVGGVALNWISDFQSEGAQASWANTTVTAGHIKHGTRAYELGVGSSTDGTTTASRAIPVTAGERWYFSVWARAHAATADGFYMSAHFGGPTEDFDFAHLIEAVNIYTDVALGTTYTHFQGYVTVPATGGISWMRVVLYCWKPSTPTIFDFDDCVAYRLVGGLLNNDGNVTIDASGITVTNGKLTVSNAGGSTIVDGDIQKVDNAPSEVVIDSTGLNVTEGAITVTNAGATVIIDGTSDMFKIAATGTMTRGYPGPAGNSNSTSTTLSGLGAFAVPPAMISLLTGDNSTVQNQRHSDYDIYMQPGAAGTVGYWGECYILLDGSNFAKVWLIAANFVSSGSGLTVAVRYYCLTEVAI